MIWVALMVFALGFGLIHLGSLSVWVTVMSSVIKGLVALICFISIIWVSRAYWPNLKRLFKRKKNLLPVISKAD